MALKSRQQNLVIGFSLSPVIGVLLLLGFGVFDLVYYLPLSHGKADSLLGLAGTYWDSRLAMGRPTASQTGSQDKTPAL